LSTEKNRRILVIDDNRGIHDDFRKILAGGKSSAGLDALETALFGDEPPATGGHYRIDSAYQGQEGLEMVERASRAATPYALAFVDMRMPPGWDGVETIEKVWQADREIQVVICSAYSDYSWEEILKKLGVSDRWLILKKPFDPAEVCQLACALTEKWQMARRADALRITNISISGDLDEKLALIEEQKRSLTRMATPILQIWDGILTVPVIGAVDAHRAEDIKENLLQSIVRTKSRYAILDFTGVDALDASTVDHFLQIIQSVQLLGAQCVVSGILPAMAQKMVEIGVDPARLTTRADLQDALKSCLRLMGQTGAAAGNGFERRSPSSPPDRRRAGSSIPPRAPK
jgi:anti-anti-sigma regulatory factor/DNA-binding NarL/FixJ family response regulator